MGEFVKERYVINDVYAGMSMLTGFHPQPDYFVDEEEEIFLRRSDYVVNGVVLYKKFPLHIVGNQHYFRRHCCGT